MARVQMWAYFITPSFWQHIRPLYVISRAVLAYTPYVVILFLDALRDQSAAFRFALPVLYLCYAASDTPPVRLLSLQRTQLPNPSGERERQRAQPSRALDSDATDIVPYTVT
jgi:hypothetical protein